MRAGDAASLATAGARFHKARQFRHRQAQGAPQLQSPVGSALACASRGHARSFSRRPSSLSRPELAPCSRLLACLLLLLSLFIFTASARMAEAAPKPAWSLKRGLALFRPADQSGPTASVTATRSRIEAFMKHWDDKAAVWSSVVPGGDKPWTGRIDFPGGALLSRGRRGTQPLTLHLRVRRCVQGHGAQARRRLRGRRARQRRGPRCDRAAADGALHGSPRRLCQSPARRSALVLLLSQAHCRALTLRLGRAGSIDYWQFLGHPDGDSQDIPGCSLWRFLELVDGVREEIHVLFKRGASSSPQSLLARPTLGPCPRRSKLT